MYVFPSSTSSIVIVVVVVVGWYVDTCVAVTLLDGKENEMRGRRNIGSPEGYIRACLHLKNRS